MSSMSEFSMPTASSVFRSVDISHLVIPPSTQKELNLKIVAIQYVNEEPKIKPRRGRIGFRLSDVISDLEKTEAGSIELSSGRKWVAETLYSEEKPTLQFFRLKAGLSQAEFAKKISTTQSRISIYERGTEQPTFEMMMRMKDVLNIDMNALSEAISYAKERREKING